MPVKDLETQDMLINMGPQHPSTHGVLRLMIRTDGEVVSEVTPVVGYLHRCAEKIGENLRYEQYVPYTDRMDYLSSMSDNLAFCLAVEKLMPIEIPARGQYLRVIFAELNRIASHLLAFGTLAHFESVLPSPPFLRLGRSLIVNRDRLRRVETPSRESARIMLQGMAEALTLGRAAAARLREALDGEN